MYSITTKLMTAVRNLRFNRKIFFIAQICALIFFSISSSQVSGQSGNIDQIRNGPANDPSKNFYDDFANPTWVNGNAGASNAHYVEGHSIGYRSLLTLLTVN